ncbi:MAG: S41 family peptidase [Gammaproteobacteria bacterium]|nr:S41 family peptidase [Gammaproteobacteria bacterium]
MRALITILLFFTSTLPALAASDNDALLDSLANVLEENYVFMELGSEMAKTLRDQQAAGRYAQLEGLDLAEALTRELRAISNDKHLAIDYSKDGMLAPPPEMETEAQRAHRMQRLREVQFGFPRAEMLPDGIGLIEITGFHSPELAGERLREVMDIVKDARALVFDLRRNGGGDPAMVAAVQGYLFTERVHLNDLEFREPGTSRYITESFFAEPVRDGLRNPDLPVYVLTSDYTFSGGEEFSYNLKHLGRGTIVGEVTGGGANPGGGFPLAEGYVAFIPTGRAVNPVTGANWEGVGVHPDIPVPAEKAMDVVLEEIRSP